MMGAISTVPDFSGEQYEISPPIVIPFPRDESRAGDDKLTLWFGCGAGLERWGQYRLFQTSPASNMKFSPLLSSLASETKFLPQLSSRGKRNEIPPLLSSPASIAPARLGKATQVVGPRA
jgi:hypothetical protein